MLKNYQKRFLPIFLGITIVNFVNAQINSKEETLPNGLTPYERSLLPTYQFGLDENEPTYAITDPPNFLVRTMAEWEEIQSLVIGRAGHYDVLNQIKTHASKEVEVIEVIDRGFKNEEGGPVSYGNSNSTIVNAPLNSVWIRDYGANTIYKNDVEDLLLVDWVYNRPRPADDKVPEAVAKEKGITLYATTKGDYKLVHTGGNFMVDGLGTAFASKLIMQENSLTEGEVDNILKGFMGINRFVKMNVLPYDGIHHIDMHMKLLDEETLLVGKYPDNTSDGPQIEANIQYVLSNFKSVWGTPYRIVRIPMPSDNGQFPKDGGDYRTYTNCTFVNKTLLVPIYGISEDQEALGILKENLLGYNVVGIDCREIIGESGAIHCVTKAIGSNDPLLIAHQRLRDDPELMTDGYEVKALIKHKSGIKEAAIYYTDDLSNAFKSVKMDKRTDDNWIGYIPNESASGTMYYYIEAEANSGKRQVRPIVAPKGYWEFKIHAVGVEENEINEIELQKVFPNPASAITCIPLTVNKPGLGRIELIDITGRKVASIFEGQYIKGEQKYFFNASEFSLGIYQLIVSVNNRVQHQKIIIK